MENLVKYESDDESDASHSPSRKHTNEAEHPGDLNSEYDAFASMITEGEERVLPPPVPPPTKTNKQLRQLPATSDNFSTTVISSEESESENEYGSIKSKTVDDLQTTRDNRAQDRHQAIPVQHDASHSEQSSGNEEASDGQSSEHESSEAGSDNEGEDGESSSAEEEDGSSSDEEEQQKNERKRKSSTERDSVLDRLRSSSPDEKKAKNENGSEGVKASAVDKKRVSDASSSDHHRHKRSDDSSGRRDRHADSSSHHRHRRSSSRSKGRRNHRSRSHDRRRRSRDRDSKHGHRSDRRKSRSRDRRDSRSGKSGGDRQRHGSSRGSGGSRRRSRERRGGRRRRSPDRRQGRRDRKRPHDRRQRSRSRQGRNARRSKSPPAKKRTFKDEMREKILAQGAAATAAAEQQQQLGAAGKAPIDIEAIKQHIAAGGSVDNPQTLLMKAALMSLPNTTGERITPQEAVRRQMEAMQQKAQEITGIALPKYYNPGAVNPLKYAEQIQKRKLLWSKPKDKKEDVNQQLWQATSFGQQDVDEKFRKLMGVKGDAGAAAGGAVDPSISKLNQEQIRKQQELFSQLDKEYMMARITTHTHRGIGLGAISLSVPEPAQPVQPSSAADAASTSAAAAKPT